ncbi:MAG: triose-phosphate isomerase [Candidatus Bathyarchaeia archaeon]
MGGLEVRVPLVLVNFKTYREATGDGCMRLARVAEEVRGRTGVCVAIAPQAIDLKWVARSVGVPVFAQHIDPVGYGKYTGHILAEAVRDAGAVGTLVNHSEKRLVRSMDPLVRKLEREILGATVKRAWEVGLKPVVCVDDVELGREVAAFEPYAVAIEPPELIGTGIPVSKAKPEVVSGAVGAVKGVNPKVKVLCGAGITSGEDVSAALRLGAEGILVASGVVKAENPFEALLDLASAARAYLPR